MKLRDILKTASRNIIQSKLRSFLTIMAIFIGALTLTLTNGIGSGISAYIDEQTGSLGAENVLIIQPKSDALSASLSSDAPHKYDPAKATTSSGYGGPAIPVLSKQDIDKIAAQSGISSVVPQLSVAPLYISAASSDKYEILVNQYVTGTELAMTAGARPDNSVADFQVSLTPQHVSVLGFANAQDAVGKQVSFGVTTTSSGATSEIKATIVGVQKKSLIGSGGANLNDALTQKMYAVENDGLKQSSLEKYPAAVAYFDKAYTTTQITDLKKHLDDAGYKAQTFQDAIGVVKQVINGIVMVLNILAVVTLVAASFGIINTLLMAVQERTKEIGLMKAMGMSAARIFLLFSVEAILLGFWGSALGVLAAIGVGQIGNKIATDSFLKDFDGLHLLAFPVQTVIGIVLLIMLIAFLAGTLPARRAAKLNPIEALRYE